MLNDRQQLFANAILAGKSNKDAAIAAGYSAASAETCGSRLLKNAKVRAFLDKNRAKAVENAGLIAKDVYSAIKDGIDFDPARLFGLPDFEGHRKLLEVADMPHATRRCLTGVKVRRIPGTEIPEEVVEFKWTPVETWTAQAARVLGLNKDKVEHDVGVTLAELLAEAGPLKGPK